MEYEDLHRCVNGCILLRKICHECLVFDGCIASMYEETFEIKCPFYDTLKAQAINIIEALSLMPKTYPAFFGGVKAAISEYEKGYTKALEDINLPLPVIIEKWNPSRCPRCNHDFIDYEPCDDGYYQRAVGLERCPYCGQNIEWFPRDKNTGEESL